jgi:TatD DNase family protein
MISTYMPQFFDTHCHLHDQQFREDRELVHARMVEQGIQAVTIGTTHKTSREAIQDAEAHEGVWAAVGYHPEYFTSSFHSEDEKDTEAYDIAEIRRLAQSSSKVVAIGETGLDFFRMDEGIDREEGKRKQEQALREQFRLACELDVALIVHCRDALTRLAEIMHEEKGGGDLRAVVHCFTGTWEEAKPLLDLGFYLSFTGIITFPPKKTEDPDKHVHRVIERMPLDRMLIETDAPYLAPVPHRGMRNEPTYVSRVAETIAQVRGMTLEDIAKQTTGNAQAFFRLH